MGIDKLEQEHPVHVRWRAFHEALFRAFFVEAKDIGDRAVLVDLAGAVGLERDVALQVLENRLYREAVDADWARARELGIRMAPTFVMNGRLLEGAKPYPILEAWFSEEGRWAPLGSRSLVNP